MKRIASHAANMMTINKISGACLGNFSNTVALTQNWTNFNRDCNRGN